MFEIAKALKSALLENLPDGISPENLSFRFYESLDLSESYLMIGIKNRKAQ